MKLSIIVPVYNAENQVQRLLKSVLCTNEDFEVICVDDGSTDRSLQVLKSVTDPRVKVYTKNNEGPFKTWQYGLKRSSGDYVTIFDADDYIDEDGIPFIFDFINNTKAEVLATPYYIESPEAYTCGGAHLSRLPLANGLYVDEKLTAARPVLVSGAFSYAKPTKVIKRENLVAQVEHSYQGKLTDFEDWATMIQVLNNAASVYISDRGYYHYVQYPNSISKSSKTYQTNYNALGTIIGFLSKSTYSRLSEETIKSIWFYGSRSVLNRSVKIKEFSLASKIITDKQFQEKVKSANIGIVEKIALYSKNSRIYYFCWKIKDIMRGGECSIRVTILPSAISQF